MKILKLSRRLRVSSSLLDMRQKHEVLHVRCLMLSYVIATS